MQEKLCLWRISLRSEAEEHHLQTSRNSHSLVPTERTTQAPTSTYSDSKGAGRAHTSSAHTKRACERRLATDGFRSNDEASPTVGGWGLSAYSVWHGRGEGAPGHTDVTFWKFQRYKYLSSTLGIIPKTREMQLTFSKPSEVEELEGILSPTEGSKEKH